MTIVALVGCSLVSSAAARADSCAYNPVCPYRHMTVIGASNPDTLVGQLSIGVTPTGNIAVADGGNSRVRLYSHSGRLLAQTSLPWSPTGIAVDPSTGEMYVAARCLERYHSADLTSAGASICGQEGGPIPSDAQIEGIAAGDGLVYVHCLNPGGPGTTETWSIVELSSSGGIITSWAVGMPGYSGSMAVDADGNLYLPGHEATVLKYNPAGQLTQTIPVASTPYSIAIHDSTLYAEASVSTGSEITSYSLTDGSQTSLDVAIPGFAGATSWTTTGGGLGPGTPSLAVGANGITAVGLHDVVDEFGLDGSPTGSIGGTSPSYFRPSGVFMDSSGNVDVVDTGYFGYDDRLVQFPAGGGAPRVQADLGSAFPDAYAFWTTATPSGGFAVEGWPVTVGTTSVTAVAEFDSAGNLLRTIDLNCNCFGPVAIGPQSGAGGTTDGDIYVAKGPPSWGQAAVQQLSPDGSLVRSWQVAGPTADSIAVDARGNVYVGTWAKMSETYAGVMVGGGEPAIDKYTSDGTLISTWDATGGFNPFNTVEGLATAPNGEVWAIGEDGVHAYSPSGKMLSVWPAPTALASGSFVSIAANGDPVVVATPWVDAEPSIVVYSGLLDPLPPVPPSSAGPFASWWAEFDNVQMDVQSASQSGNGAVTASVTCTRSNANLRSNGACYGSADLSTSVATSSRSSSRRRHRPVALGHLVFKLRVGHHARVRVALTRRGRWLLKHRHRLSVTLRMRYRKSPSGKLTSAGSRHLLLRHRRHRPAPHRLSRALG